MLLLCVENKSQAKCAAHYNQVSSSCGIISVPSFVITDIGEYGLHFLFVFRW